MESYEEYRAAIDELKKKAHNGCATCENMLRELEYWLNELYEAQSELKALLESYGSGGVLENKRRKLEKEEFEALEKLDELLEELEEHLGG
jgi:uncharacterized coiled-coil DUF342 family protein